MDDIINGGSHDADKEEQSSNHRRGGWITVPFLLVTIGGLTIGGLGWLSNLIVYLIEEFNVKSIDAAQVYNIFNGSSSFMPLIGAIIADSFLGCYSVIFISSVISLLGLILITLTSTLDFLRPESCLNSCNGPSRFQLAILYTSLTLACIGQGGIRFALATMGANQFNNPKDQAAFFNWFFFALYSASVFTSTVIVYVQDNIGWGWGYGICVGGNVIGLSFFLLGSRFYRRIGPQGSPFTSIARVIVASFWKCRVKTKEGDEYFHGDSGKESTVVSTENPSKSFRFLNQSALKTEDAMNSDGSIAKKWKLCTVQQVEDLKTIIRIIPLGSTSIFLFTPIGILVSMVVLQARTMDRRLGDHFKIPAASILVFVFTFTCLSLAIFDKLLYPTWRKIIGRQPTPLQQIGVGHVLNILSMVIAAVIEARRRHLAHLGSHADSVVPMSVMWLVPQLAVNGVAEAFQFPGQVALFYQEFPPSLKTVSTAVVAMIFAVALYISTAVIGLIQKVTDWLSDDINEGKIENVYWVCAVIGVINFVYYLVCAFLYKYQNVEVIKVDDPK